MMDSDLAYVLLTEQQLHDREEELGRILTEEYADKRPIFLGILRGVVVFYADMVRRIPIPCDFDFMSVSSYEGSESTGRVKVQLDTRYESLVSHRFRRLASRFCAALLRRMAPSPFASPGNFFSAPVRQGTRSGCRAAGNH